MKTIGEIVKEATDSRVTNARAELRTTTNRVDGELSRLDLETHFAVVAQLQIMVEYRRQIMSMAAAEEQHKQQIAQHEADVRARQNAFEERKKLQPVAQ